jgi:hypothetical protein
MRNVRVVGSVDAGVVTRLAAEGFETLADALRFGFLQRPAWDVAEIVVQDEFTHDVVIAGPAPAFLVLDTT